MHWQWCGTESTAKTNYAGWRGFSTVLYGPWQSAVQWGRKGPSSHQTAPKKERSPFAAQLTDTQGTCITLSSLVLEMVSQTLLLYTPSGSHTAGRFSASRQVSGPQNSKEMFLKSWLMITNSSIWSSTQNICDVICFSPRQCSSLQSTLCPVSLCLSCVKSACSLRALPPETLWTGEWSAAIA